MQRAWAQSSADAVHRTIVRARLDDETVGTRKAAGFLANGVCRVA
jgi:hypothetical protein